MQMRGSSRRDRVVDYGLPNVPYNNLESFAGIKAARVQLTQVHG
jgi:hypothetical protein